MSELSIQERARSAFAARGFASAGADALPDDWKAKFAELAPADGDWYVRSEDPSVEPVHKFPDHPAQFLALWKAYQEAQKAVVDPPPVSAMMTAGQDVSHKEVTTIER